MFIGDDNYTNATIFYTTLKTLSICKVRRIKLTETHSSEKEKKIYDSRYTI